MALLTLAGATAAGGVAGALYRRPPAPWVLLASAALVAAAVAVFLIRRRERTGGPGGSVSWSVPAEGPRREEAAFTLVPGAGRSLATGRTPEPQSMPFQQAEQTREPAAEPVVPAAEPEPAEEPAPAPVEEPAVRGGAGVLDEWHEPASAPATSWWTGDTGVAGSDDEDDWWGPDPFSVDPDGAHAGSDVSDREEAPAETHSGSARRP